MVSHQTKGIWIDMLCYLWESPERGKLEGTHQQFIKMLGCNKEEWDTFFNDASVTKFANVTDGNGIVTVCNRRMYRDGKNRQNTRLRVQRYREKQQGNAKSNATSNGDVTPSSSSSPSKRKERKEIAKDIISYLNEIGGYSYTDTKANLEMIQARLEEGHTKKECKQVIDTKWNDPDFNKKYFRPSTLFRPTKFEGYLNEKPIQRYT